MRRFRFFSALIPLAAGAVILVFLLITLGPALQEQASEQRLRVAEAVRYASVQCYALEGAYPADVEYLMDHYGVKYDESRFFVHYRPNGANIAPDITVIDSLNKQDE